MEEESKDRNRARYLRAAARLNADRAKMESAYVLKKGKPVRFYPCEKSYVFLAATHAAGEYRPNALRAPGLADINNDTPGEAVLMRAYMTTCECHNGIGFEELRELEYQEEQ